MAHPAQQQFCQAVKVQFPEYFANSRVLEIGARNVNGTLRDLFEGSSYVGVDAAAGSGVDVVCLGHEYVAEPGSFDVVCSAETFEHDPHAAATVAHMVRLLRPGGLFFMSCAGEGRSEHGTSRTGKNYGPDTHFYHNVCLHEFVTWLSLAAHPFQEVMLRHNRENCDLYFYGIKA